MDLPTRISLGGLVALTAFIAGPCAANAQTLDAGKLYEARCSTCHGQAVELVRSRLVMRDGRLLGRKSGRRVKEFLSYHGRLRDDEVTMMIEELTRRLKDGQGL